MTENRQSLIEHLADLRNCLIRSLIGLLIGMAVSLYFSKKIFEILQKPLLEVLPSNSHFITTSPLEAWVTYMKVAFLTGIFLSSPWILLQIWRFIAPGLHLNEKRMALLFVSLTTFFFVGGGLFGYFVIFPIGFRFFVTALAGTEIQLLPQMQQYLGFISKMLLTFGLIFEMPVVLALLGRIGIVNYRQLSKARRYVLVAAFLIAGILTPGPDVLSQLLLALPLLVLYEFSVLIVRIIGR